MEYFEFYDLKEYPHEFVISHGQSVYASRQTICERIYHNHKEEIEGVLFYQPNGSRPPWFR